MIEINLSRLRSHKRVSVHSPQYYVNIISMTGVVQTTKPDGELRVRNCGLVISSLQSSRMYPEYIDTENDR